MFSPTASPVIKEMERCLYAELNELHRILSAAGILVYRNFVLTVAQRQGESANALRSAVRAVSTKCIEHCHFKSRLSSREIGRAHV